MKINLFTILTFLFCISSLNAQHDKREKLKAHKAAYITQKLNLSSKEAEEFWPVYNAYEKKYFQLRVLNNREVRKKIKNKGGVDALTEKESNNLLSKYTDNEQLILTLKKELYVSLKNIISAKKILKLTRAEHEFNRKLLVDFRKKNMKTNH
ncbi:MAG: sensor of ECF-type sigma factor [Flavobacteriaceae bacterium]|nr:sensor of ECF-type sigma factor [Flavobacteriaceae bacterium]